MNQQYITNTNFSGFRGPSVFLTKIRQFINRLETNLYSDFIIFNAIYANCKDHLNFKQRKKLSYKKIQEGDTWGKEWETGWFHLKIKVPKKWDGAEIAALLDFNGEALIFSKEGEILQGLTNGSVFGEVTRNIYRFNKKARKNETIELWIEAAANNIMGIVRPIDPPGIKDDENNSKIDIDSSVLTRHGNLNFGNKINRDGSHIGVVNKIRLVSFSQDVYLLIIEMKLLLNLLDTIDENSMLHDRIMHHLLKITNLYKDDHKNISECRKIIKPFLNKKNNSTVPTINAVGHAHIDTGWLWPVKETIRKCARTFSNQLVLLDRYPDYIFGASQPQHYQFVKDHYPNLYLKIKKSVELGRWELQGGMWVEADCNLISGESMVRQIVHGKIFFMDEFGEDVKNCWIPDVFGYSAAMPQILKLSGIKYFLTQKIGWNATNRFPHTTFLWKGIDGTKIITHFPPEDTYNSQLKPNDLKYSEKNFKEKSFLNDMICLFGVGDGGGGPTEEMIERGILQKNLEGVPNVKFNRADDFFRTIEKKKENLPVWSGELYLEYHRGTFTTQAKTKLGNNLLEKHLIETEILYTFGNLNHYPLKELVKAWKVLLLNQFHDILPGSSIKMVYEQTESEYNIAIDHCKTLKDELINKISKKDNKSITLFNSLNFEIHRDIEIGEGLEFSLISDDGNVPTQIDSDGKMVAQIKLPPLSFKTFTKTKKLNKAKSVKNLILENDLIRYEFNKNGQIISAIDKELQHDFIGEKLFGNSFVLYEDRPHGHDAWEIDIYYEDMMLEEAKYKKWKPNGNGEVRNSIIFDLIIGNSLIKQKVILNHFSKELVFQTEVDWRERHKMLRVLFPTSIYSDEAFYGIQFGYVKRPTHRNTSWDLAKFEVPAHKYADLSDNTKGAAIFTDCKYGFKIHENIMEMNLLRSPTYPDPDADIGKQKFTYSFYPHKNHFLNSDVINKSNEMNRLPLIYDNKKLDQPLKPLIKILNNDISIEAIKKAEKENCYVIRLVEQFGKTCETGFELQDNYKLTETNLMEWEEFKTIKRDEKISFKPFEIKTYKIKGGK